MMDKTAILVGRPILARGTNLGCQNWSGWTDFGSKNWSGGPVLAGFSAKISPAGPILGGTDFGVTGHRHTYIVVDILSIPMYLSFSI